MSDPANNRRVGLVLMASAGGMALFAALIALDVIALADEIRLVVAGVLAVAAIVDAVIGVRFLTTSTR